MKREHIDTEKIYSRETHSIFKNQGNIKESILKYNSEKNKVHKTIVSPDFKYFYVV